MAQSSRAPRRSSEERDAEVRAQLTPLEPDERPVPLLVAVVVAGLLALVNLVLFASGNDGGGAGGGSLVAYCGVMAILSVGMWRKSYLALLGFQVLLGIIVVFFFLFLLRAATVWEALLALAIICPAGYLFWKLIRVLARIQTPRKGDVDPGRT